MAQTAFACTSRVPACCSDVGAGTRQLLYYSIRYCSPSGRYSTGAFPRRLPDRGTVGQSCIIRTVPIRTDTVETGTLHGMLILIVPECPLLNRFQACFGKVGTIGRSCPRDLHGPLSPDGGSCATSSPIPEQQSKLRQRLPPSFSPSSRHVSPCRQTAPAALSAETSTLEHLPVVEVPCDITFGRSPLSAKRQLA